MPSREGMSWPIYVYLIASVAIAGSAAFKIGWGSALSIAVTSFFALVAGGGLKASLFWGDKTQKVGGPVVALIVVGLAQWLASGFSVWLFGDHLSGNLWCWIGFAIGLIFTTKKLAAPGTARSPVDESADLIGKLGELMERYPTALMDSSRLPASKQTMKTAIKDVWRREPGLRGQLAHAYLHLSHFQDGIGSAVLDCQLPGDAIATADDVDALRREAIDLTKSKGEDFSRWIAWSKVSTSEMEILVQEWQTFEREASASTVR